MAYSSLPIVIVGLMALPSNPYLPPSCLGRIISFVGEAFWSRPEVHNTSSRGHQMLSISLNFIKWPRVHQMASTLSISLKWRQYRQKTCMLSIGITFTEVHHFRQMASSSSTDIISTRWHDVYQMAFMIASGIDLVRWPQQHQTSLRFTNPEVCQRHPVLNIGGG